MVTPDNFSIHVKLTFNYWFEDSVISFYGNQEKYNQAVIDSADPYKPCGEVLLKMPMCRKAQMLAVVHMSPALV